MSEPWSLPARLSTSDLMRVLSPGQVTGIYDGASWIDWEASPSPEIKLLPLSRIARPWMGGEHHFCCLLEPGSGCENPFIGASLLYLLAHSRGVALVSSRTGFLLRWSQRLLYPALTVRERISGPYRPRTSGSRHVSHAGSVRLADREEVLQSATLSLNVRNPHTLIAVLSHMFPTLQATQETVHIPLAGHRPEEILGLLRSEGVKVGKSVVWYAQLQSPPTL